MLINLLSKYFWCILFAKGAKSVPLILSSTCNFAYGGIFKEHSPNIQQAITLLLTTTYFNIEATVVLTR
jgi:hypothetical protein